jgi:hypothetical protein
VVRSASCTGRAIAPALLLVALGGCATTQLQATRLQLNSARIRASELAVRVSARNPDVSVERVELLLGRPGSAIVVRLKNLLAHPVSDLPISVGVTVAGGHRRYLNGAPGTDYFLTHTPAIAAGGVLTWVYTNRRPLAPGARPFAAVGLTPAPLASRLRALPRIAVATLSGTSHDRSALQRVRVIVRNLSSVPQYALQVYLIARRSGRDVLAGRATITHLGARASVALNIRLVGKPHAGRVTLEAPPTIFG